MAWKIVYAKQALEDIAKLNVVGLKFRTDELLSILTTDPFRTPPTFEKVAGELASLYVRRINSHHNIVYEVFIKEKTVRILRIDS